MIQYLIKLDAAMMVRVNATKIKVMLNAVLLHFTRFYVLGLDFSYAFAITLLVYQMKTFCWIANS